MIPALAFLPINDVVEAFETLEEVMPEKAQPIMDYFEDTYIGRLRRRNRRAPCFPISMWNMHERIILDLPRTNNSLEGWHNHIQANVAAHHPNIWKFLSVLKNEEASNRVRINQMIAGTEPSPKRKNM